jgi:hypothetical protein
LIGDRRAAVVFTDPPYNVPIQGHASGLGDPSCADSTAWPDDPVLHDLYGAFSVKRLLLGFSASSLFGAGMPFFVPSPAVRFAERAEGVKGPKR